MWAAYSPVKNSPPDARAKAAAGSPSHSATTGELDIYQANCRWATELVVRCHSCCHTLIQWHAAQPTSCPVLSCPVLSCPVLSCPVLSCPVLSCPVLSCPVLLCTDQHFSDIGISGDDSIMCVSCGRSWCCRGRQHRACS